MAKIKSGASSDLLTIDPISKAARVIEYSIPGSLPPTSNIFTVTGWTTSVVAASLAADTNLMAFTNAATKRCFITMLEWKFSVATVGALGTTSGAVVWQRFSGATPTGGTSRLAAVCPQVIGDTTTVADIRDSNAALTGSAPTWGTVIAAQMNPVYTAPRSGISMKLDLRKDPLIIAATANTGFGIRTGTLAMPATQTWMFTYSIQWYEAT